MAHLEAVHLHLWSKAKNVEHGWHNFITFFSRCTIKFTTMKRHIFLLLAIFTSLVAALAQSPVPDADTLRNPVKQGDPEVRVIPPQADYRKNLVTIKQKDIPAPLRKTLGRPEYKGWEKGTLYRNKEATFYLLEIQEPIKTRVYRFDKYGKRDTGEDL